MKARPLFGGSPLFGVSVKRVYCNPTLGGGLEVDYVAPWVLVNPLTAALRERQS